MDHFKKLIKRVVEAANIKFVTFSTNVDDLPLRGGSTAITAFIVSVKATIGKQKIYYSQFLPVPEYFLAKLTSMAVQLTLGL